MNKAKSILILLLFPLFLTAQKATVSGIVKNKNTGETLMGASVYLKNTSVGVTSNEYGFYSLTTLQGTYTLVVEYIGFTKVEKKIDLSDNIKLAIELIEENVSLQEVVISSKSEKTNVRTPQMSVKTLSSQKIKEIPAVLGEVDIIKSIQLLPGVTNAGEGASGFNVRGGAEDQNLILLDEAIVYNSSHLLGFFSVFNNDVIKDVKLYKGGIPSQYGGRASSVLDIRQKEGNNQQFHLEGGIGLISSRLTAQGPIVKNKSSFLVAGRASYAHLFLKFTDIKSTVSFYDLNMKLHYDISENSRLYLSGYFGRDNFKLDQSFTNLYGSSLLNLRWNYIFNDKLFSNLSLNYSKYDYNVDVNVIGLDWDSNIDNVNVKYDFNYYANSQFKFNFGVNSIYYDFNPGFIKSLNKTSIFNDYQLDKKYALENALYGSAEHKITNKLTFRYGLRWSHFIRLGKQSLTNYKDNKPLVYDEKLGVYEKGITTGKTTYKKGQKIIDFNHFEPRLSLSYRLNQKSSIKASYNKIAQYLHLIYNTSSATPLDIWTPSGTFIKPQIAHQYAIGYFRNFNDNQYSIEVEAYYKTIANRIDYVNGADLVAQNNLETQILEGKSRAMGVELLLQKNVGNLTGWLSYTLSKSEQQTLGGIAGGEGINNGEWYNTPYDRTHDVSVTATYKLNERWKFGSNFVFQTGRPVTYPNGKFKYNGLLVATYGDRNSNRLPFYHRLDFSATLTPRKNTNRKWKGEWVFSIYNVYNRNNALSISFRQNEDTGKNEATRTSVFGIVPSVTYNFKF